MPKKKPTTRAKSLGNWTTANGDLEYEARIFDERGECGCEIVVRDVGERLEIVLAVGKAELDQVIKILESARCQVDMLPPDLQKSPEDDGDEEEEDEEADEEELDEEEADA